MERAGNRSTQRVVLFGVATGVFAFAFWRFLTIQRSNDFESHIEYARRLASGQGLESPHFLFQVLLNALVTVAPVSYIGATVILLGLCYGAMALCILAEADHRGLALPPGRAVMLISALLLASHVFLPTLLRRNFYYGYFVPICYHNPTQQLGKVVAVAILFLYAWQFLAKAARPEALRVAALAGLCVLSALAKPSFLIAFLPCAGLVACWRIVRGDWPAGLAFLAGIGLPTAAVLLWQAWFAYGTESASHVIFAPFAVFTHPAEVSWKLVASLAFPIAVWVLYWPAARSDVRMRFVGLVLAVSLFYTLFLAESGPRLSQGNFAWTGQTAVFLTYVECFLFLLAQPPGRSARRAAAWMVFGLHVTCGVIWYVAVCSYAWGSFR